jgi:hypothetical protein
VLLAFSSLGSLLARSPGCPETRPDLAGRICTAYPLVHVGV